MAGEERTERALSDGKVWACPVYGMASDVILSLVPLGPNGAASNNCQVHRVVGGRSERSSALAMFTCFESVSGRSRSNITVMGVSDFK